MVLGASCVTVRAIEDIRNHDLRCTYASQALGESLPMIGRPRGDVQAETTERHSDMGQVPVPESAIGVSESNADDYVAGLAELGASI